MHRTVRSLALAFAVGPIAVPASAECFTVLTRSNQIVYRSTQTPIDLSGPITPALHAKFPGTLLVISSDQSSCTTIVPSSPVNPMSGIVQDTTNQTFGPSAKK